MKALLSSAAVALALATTPVVAQTPAPAPAPAPAPTAPAAPVEVTNAQDFVVLASSSNALEIASSEMALEKAESDEIRAFAEQMIADHTAATERLTAAAEEQGVMMPPADAEGAMTVSEQHQAMLDGLSAAEGAAFDAQYAQLQVMAHEEAVALFGSYAEAGEEGPLKTFAAETLPALEEHLAMAQELPTS